MEGQCACEEDVRIETGSVCEFEGLRMGQIGVLSSDMLFVVVFAVSVMSIYLCHLLNKDKESREGQLLSPPVDTKSCD